MKRLTGLILCIALALQLFVIPAFAADTPEVFLCESFDGYATNSSETLFEHKGDPNARVVEDGKENKAFVMPTSYTANTLKYKFETEEKMYVVSMKVRYDGGKTGFKVSLADSANQEFSLFSVGNDGKISLSNGRSLGSVRDDAYTQIDMGYNAYVKRYFVRVNGKHIVSDYIAKTSFTNPASFNVKTFIGTDKSAIYFDEVKIYSGSEVRDDIKGAAYSDKSVEYVYVDTAKMEKPVFINNNFNTKAKAMNGLAVYNKDNVIEYMPLSDTEGCIVMDKTIDASDPFIDIALAGGVNSLDIVLEADVSSDKLGSTLYLFNVKSDEGISVNTFRVLPTGSITLYNGTVIGEVNKGEFTSVAAVYHFMEGTFDAYVNKKLVKENVAIGGKINAATTVRIQQMPSQGNGRILLDNIKMYDGKVPYTLTGETVDRYTVLPDDSEDINNLKGTVAFHDRGKYLFAKTQRLDLGVTPYYEGNTLMVSKDLIEKGFNLKVTENANGSVAIGDSIKLTIGSNQMTVGGKTHTLDAAPKMTENGLYLPIKNIAELALEKQYLHDDYGSVIISDMPFRHADNITVMKAISTYLIFPRLTYEKVDELFEASGYKNVHPRLFANAQDFENIKFYAKQDARVNEWMTSVIKEADSYIGTEPVSHYLQNNQMLECAHKIADRILACSFAYRITGDGKYANRAWIEMENCSVNFPNWNFQHFLDVGETTYAVAVGYDWCYDWMNDEQRAVVRNAIKYFGLEEGRKQYQGKPTGTYFVFQNMNWNAVCNGGLMAGACAIYEDEPESAKYTIINALRSLEYMMPEFAPDGAWVEGSSYWNYAMRFMVYMLESSKYIMGSDFDITSYTGVNRTSSFIFGLDGNAGTNGYHDAGSEHVLSPELMWLGTEFDDAGLVNAYLDRIDMLNVAGGMYHCLYYDPAYVGKAATQMPLDILSKGPEAGSMRSSWTDKNGMWLSYHGGKVVVNHYHVDKGTFVIDMLGERWATEIGGDSLSYTGNFNGARTDLYALRPEGHNCYVINPNEGPGQEMTGDCRVFRTESKPKGAIHVMDLTSVYVNDVNRAHRGFMLTDDRRTAVIRDEIDLLKDSEIYWFMHTDAKVEIMDKNKVILTKNGKRMQMDIICDGGTFEVKEMEEKPLPTSPIIEGQTDKSSFTKIAIIVKGSGLVNISTRYTPADEYTADIPFVCGSIDSWSIPDGEVTPLPFANGVYADGKLLYNFDKDKCSYSVKVSAGESVPKITVDSGSYTMETLQTATKIGESSSFKLSDGNGKYSIVVVNIEERPSLEAIGGKKRLAPDEIYASSNPEAHNPDAHASDGNLTSRWAANGAQTLTCVYAEPVEVSAVAVAVMNWATRRYVFSIEVSQDGKNWTTIYSGNTKDGVEGYQTFEFTPVKTRYIRYSGSGNNENAWNTIAEFAVLQ